MERLIPKNLAYKYIHKHRFYYRFKDDPDSLMENEKGNFVIQYTPNERTHLFAIFKNPEHFYIWQKTIPDNEKFFCEYITTEDRKLYIDMDFKYKELEKITNQENYKDFVEKIIGTVIQELLKIISFDLRKLQRYNSNGSNKFSYHLVLDGYKFHVEELEAIIKKVIATLPDQIRQCKFLDANVYHKGQAFRMINNYKSASNRVKRLEREWNFLGDKIKLKLCNRLYDDEEDQAYTEFISSLVSVVENCEPHPPLSLPIQTKRSNTTKTILTIENESLQQEWIGIIIDSVERLDENLVFEKFDEDDNRIDFNRINGGDCIFTGNNHDRLGSYVYLNETNNIVFAYLYCRSGHCCSESN